MVLEVVHVVTTMESRVSLKSIQQSPHHYRILHAVPLSKFFAKGKQSTDLQFLLILAWAATIHKVTYT